MLKKVIKTYLILIVLMVFGYQAYSQTITINGRVVDAVTKEPLPYANVRIDNEPVGVVTNIVGEFTFHIPSELQERTLIISPLGYSIYAARVRDLAGQNLIIELDPVDIVLDEVVIMDSLTAGEIFSIAYERIELNYPMEAYSMDAFYRDIKNIDGKYTSLLEAAIRIYDKSYESPKNPDRLRERVALEEVRKSVNYGVDSKLFDQFNLLEEFLFENNIKYRTFEITEEFLQYMRRGEITEFNGHKVFEIFLLGDNDFELLMYIDIEDYKIYWYEFSYGTEEKPIFTVERKKYNEEIIKKKKIIEFKEYRNRLYPSFVRVSTKSQWRDIQDSTIVNVTELAQEMLINNIEVDNPEWISSSKKMRGYGLQYQDMPYNEEFWKNYNVLKNSPVDDQVLADLEELGAIEEQFKKNQ